MNKPPKILYFTKYSRNAGSSRLRSFQYFPFLEEAGFKVEVSPLFGEHYLEHLYAGKSTKKEAFNGYLKRFLKIFSVKNDEVLIIEKELFPYFPAFAEQILKVLGVKYIVDYDDAVFHNYDLSSNTFIKSILGNKIDTVMKNAAVVVAGNSYLAERAKNAGANRIEIIPTVIDLDRYPLNTETENIRKDNIQSSEKSDHQNNSTPKFVIGWIGTKSTFEKHLLPQKSWILKAQEIEGVEFHIVGITANENLGEKVKYIPWTEASEVSEIQKFDVGIMPLEDSPWEKGKCSYKIIQYFACGIPAIASPIGMNREVVIPHENGFWASADEEWLTAIKTLKQSKELQNNLGLQGRSAVENTYSIQVTAKKWIGILNDNIRS